MKTKYLVFSYFIIVILLLVGSIWVFIPSVRLRLSVFINKQKYRLIPSEEFQVGRKYFYSTDNRNIYSTKDGRIFTSKGALTEVVYPSGRNEKIYHGYVLSITGEKIVSSSQSSQIVDYFGNKYQYNIVIKDDNGIQNLVVSEDVVVRKPLWQIRDGKTVGKFNEYEEVTISAINIGDYLYYEATLSPSKILLLSKN